MRRKIIERVSGIFCFAVMLLTGCGSGTSTPTPVGTVVSLVQFKGYFVGKSAAGSQILFPLTGSDTSGNTWVGSHKIISDGTTVFENIPVTKSRIVVTLANVLNQTPSTTLSRYFTTDESLYKEVYSSGVTGTPLSQKTVPDIIHVGEFGNLWVVYKSDGTSESATWKLEPDINGNSKLTYSFVYKDLANVEVGTESDTFYLDSAGNPYKESVTLTTGGVTITVSGNRT